MTQEEKIKHSNLKILNIIQLLFLKGITAGKFTDINGQHI